MAPGARGANPDVRLRTQIWAGIRPFFVSFTQDLAKFCLALVGLYAIFVFVNALRLAGYDEARLKPVQDITFWATYATVLVLLVDFLLKLSFSILISLKRPDAGDSDSHGSAAQVVLDRK